MSRHTLSVLVENTPYQLAALIRVLEPFGIRELVPSGVVGVARGSRPMVGSDFAQRSVDRSA